MRRRYHRLNSVQILKFMAKHQTKIAAIQEALETALAQYEIPPDLDGATLAIATLKPKVAAGAETRCATEPHHAPMPGPA